MGRYQRSIFCGGLLVAVALIVAGCAGAPAAASPGGDKAANGPRIAVSEESFDFGKVPLDKLVAHTFQIKNVGTAPLVLRGEPKVRAVQGCWPPRAVVGATTIKPGESTTMFIETAMHEGMDGPHLFAITIASNDPAEAQKVVQVKAHFGK